MPFFYRLLIIPLLFATAAVTAQTGMRQDSLIASNEKTDLAEIIKKMRHKNNGFTAAPKKTVLMPVVGYSLATGFAAAVAFNKVFYKSTAEQQKASSILCVPTYTQKKQFFIPFTVNIWSAGNKYNFISDIRYSQYPSIIYGIGNNYPDNGYAISYHALKLHQIVQREIIKNFYVGTGVYFDKYWNITTTDSLVTDVKQRLNQLVHTKETAIAPVLKLLYDSRLNQVNPRQGIYTGMVVRQNIPFSSQKSWRSLLIDLRTYIEIPKHSTNILAIWNYNWLAPSTNTVPYLLLPSTGWDDNYNTGRGYTQSRFRGHNMFYNEAEYRARITKNDLLHAVFFGNMQVFSGELSKTYTQPQLGYGLGLRIKVNKFSDTNFCIDYGFGKNGSRGFFVNLGEVF
jgi:hypothetical protein